MSLKSNIVANYASQIYATLAGIIMIPVYLHYMGAESYGLVGIFTMLQGWLQFMDTGLSAGLSREVTRYRARRLTENQINDLQRSLVALFVGIGLLFAITIWQASGWIASSWLQAHTLTPVQIAQCVSLMGLAAAMRWIAGLYKGVVNGWEKQVWLGWYSVVVATVRYVCVLAVFMWIGVDPLTFFTFQMIVSFGELSVLWWKADTLLPRAWARPSLNVEPLKAMWRFSGALTIASILSMVITQTDKLVLSKTLTLTNYGYFTVAIIVANGINLTAGPISGALLPRLTYFYSQGDSTGLQNLYRNATQWVAIVVWSTAGVVAFFAEPLLFAWTKDPVLSKHSAPVLLWYSLGNACLVMTSFPYHLQFAHGNMRLHMIGNAVFVVVMIPGIVLAAIYYGAVGAGRMWFAAHLTFFMAWTTIVHRRIAPGLHWRWLSRDVLPIAVIAISATWIMSEFAILDTNRLYAIAQLVVIALLSLTTASIASSYVRSRVLSVLLKK